MTACIIPQIPNGYIVNIEDNVPQTGDNHCWNSTTHGLGLCWSCRINDQETTDNELTISPKNRDGTDVNVEIVRFSGGDVTKMLKIININSNKQILQVELEATKTRVLNAQFFGNSTQNLKYFLSHQNYNLSVEASAFQNFAELEFLNLDNNEISSIPPNTFRGLNKLVWLKLSDNKLTAINENWFEDLTNLEELALSQNQLEDIPDSTFENLYKLKKLSLDRNKIETITRRCFQYNQQLEEIRLDNNQIKVIQSGSFAHLYKLSLLTLSGNKCANKDYENKNPEEISAGLSGCQPTICLIPFIPNGYIVNIEDNVKQTVGDSAGEYNPVKVVCLPSFSLFHESANQTENECQNEVWKEEIWAECHRK